MNDAKMTGGSVDTGQKAVVDKGQPQYDRQQREGKGNEL
jgi:hypothetical protein